MRWLILSICLTGCGQVVPDKVEVEHTINIDVILPYVDAYCREVHLEDPEQVQECVQYTIGKLLSEI